MRVRKRVSVARRTRGWVRAKIHNLVQIPVTIFIGRIRTEQYFVGIEIYGRVLLTHTNQGSPLSY